MHGMHVRQLTRDGLLSKVCTAVLFVGGVQGGHGGVARGVVGRGDVLGAGADELRGEVAATGAARGDVHAAVDLPW